MIDIRKLSQEDVNLLDELAQDTYLWPLLLSLVRGELSHNLKWKSFTFSEAIKILQAKLHDKGLAALTKTIIEEL